MYRHSPGRSQRSKGIKIKHVLQICLLLAVCFWLIYQVKHSNDKKKVLDTSEAETKISFNTRTADEVIKLGRKDLLPKSEEAAKITEKEDEEETEEETGGEDEGSKREEEDKEEDKSEEDKDEGIDGGDDEIDEHEQGKFDTERDHEEDLVDEHEQGKSDTEGDHEEDMVDNEKDGEESDETENDDKNVEDEEGQSQTKKEISLEDRDHDGVARNTHEAREENYKGDDASSAVTHDTQTVENENGTVENSNGNAENENEKKVDNNEELNASANFTREKVEDGETAKDGGKENSDENTEADSLKHKSEVDNSEKLNSGDNTKVKVEDVRRDENGISSNVTTKEIGSEGTVSDSSMKSTVMVESNSQLVPSNISADAIKDSSMQNGAELTTDSIQAQNTSEKATTFGEGSDPNQASFDSTGTLAPENAEETTKGSLNLSSKSEFVGSQNNTRISSDSSDSGDSSGFSGSEAVSDASLEEHSDTSYEGDGTDESSGSLKTENEVATGVGQNEHLDTSNEREGINFETENLDEIPHDPIDSYDSSLHQEEKEVRTDLDTLPDIRTDGSNSDNVSAE